MVVVIHGELRQRLWRTVRRFDKAWQGKMNIFNFPVAARYRGGQKKKQERGLSRILSCAAAGIGARPKILKCDSALLPRVVRNIG